MSLLSNPNMHGSRRFRELLSSSDVIQAPGAYDCLSARLIEAAGFPIVYMTGFGTSASYLGRPDVGLLGMSEMVDNARRIADAVSVPVIADADTGYGNAINVIRTVQAYERAGVAAIHIEDQLAPKKCGHLEGKQLIPATEMVQKICAAIDARNSSDFAIMREPMLAPSRVSTVLWSARTSTAKLEQTFCLSRHPKTNEKSKRSLGLSMEYRCCLIGPRAAKRHPFH
jgi:2,3-dimethylmalate lyase